MRVPDWRKLTLSEGLFPEPVLDNNGLVFWLPVSQQRESACWERIATVAGAEISDEQGICAISASSIRARRQGFFANLWQRLRPGSGGQAWTLPNGQSVEQVGPRRSDLLLAWVADDMVVLDEARIKLRWPGCQQVRKLGRNLYLVYGVEPPPAKNAAEAAPAQLPQESPVQLAEQMLAVARRAGDRRKEASALTDLGILLARQGNAQKAVSLLEEALTLVRQQGDRAWESDVLDNLGLAVLATGQPQRALELFQQSLEGAREASDPFAEKMALFHLGLAYSAMRDVAPAFAFLDQALVIARKVGDREHEADLLWQLGIVHAEAGQREQALAKTQEAVDLFQKMSNPQADWLASQLQKYQVGESSSPLAGVGVTQPGSSPFFGGQIVAGGWTDQGIAPSQTPETSGPGLLRMAFTTMKSMARFAGAGFKATPADTYQRRLQTCGQCQHHTGLRCKLCGCFTSVKAWMPHESCPIGKWPG